MIQTVQEFSEQVMLVSKYSAYSNVGWSRMCRKFTKEIVAGYASFKIAHIFKCWKVQTVPENCKTIRRRVCQFQDIVHIRMLDDPD
jgi:hypothetical protein